MSPEKNADNSKAPKSAQKAFQETTNQVIEEVEQTGTLLVGEFKKLFDSLVERTVEMAQTAAETTTSMTDDLISKEPVELFKTVLDEMKEMGESSLQMIDDQFETLRKRVLVSTAEKRTNSTKKKRTTTKKKATAKKKVAAKKKATAKKKVAAKKKAAPKKKAAVKKKAAAKKKVAAKKKAAPKKKAAAKKKKVAVKKKAITRKKSTAKKKVSRKKATS